MIVSGAARHRPAAGPPANDAPELAKTARLSPSERVVDIECGVGDASILAARTGARVTGIDRSERLVEEATDRAYAQRLDVMFLVGDANAIPLRDGETDVVLSAFGIGHADPGAAVAEIARITAPRSRVLLSVWRSDSLLHRATVICRGALDPARPDDEPRSRWDDDRAVAELFAAHGFTATIRESPVHVAAASVDDFVDRDLLTDPRIAAYRDELSKRGDWPRVHAEITDAAERANEASDGFRMATGSVLVSANRT